MSLGTSNKRARSDSGSDTPSMLANQGTSHRPAENPGLPAPHEELWYEDGNIQLATDAHLYRVHKSVLIKQSTAFKDMFELPNTPPEVGEETEGAWCRFPSSGWCAGGQDGW